MAIIKNIEFYLLFEYHLLPLICMCHIADMYARQWQINQFQTIQLTWNYGKKLSLAY